MKITKLLSVKLLSVILSSIAVSACGGGGGGGSTGTAPVLPTGYVVQGGLTWMQVTFQDTFTTGNAYCANTTLNSQTGWRMPTQTELVALYNSGAMKNNGWTLNYTWSSTPGGNAGTHYGVNLIDGGILLNDDRSNAFFVSCVR